MKLTKFLSILFVAVTIISCSSGGGKKEANADDSASKAPKDSITTIKDYHSNGNLWHVKEAINVNYGVAGAKPKWVLHGTVKEYYENNKDVLATETEYVKGKKEGKSIKFYKSGKPYIERDYIAGRKEGLVKKYYESGKILSETPYKFDMLGLGTQEYNTTGEELTMPELIVWTSDKRRENGSYTIYAKVQKKTNVSTTVMKAEFFSGLLIDSKYSHPNLKKETKIKNKVVSITFYESTGFPPFVNVVAKTVTPKGTPVLLSKMVNIK